LQVFVTTQRATIELLEKETSEFIRP